LLYFYKIDYLFFIFVYSLDKKAKATLSTITMTTSINSSDHVSFSVARERLKEFFEKFVPSKRDYCINPECVKETESAVLYIWEAHSQAYEHIDRQAALNITTARVNGKPHWIRSHYCCECFKKHVLVGKNKNASQHYGNYCDGVQEVEVYFHNEPWPSTWFNCVTKEDHVLTEHQEYMLAHN
jgi:hypothetical protein